MTRRTADQLHPDEQRALISAWHLRGAVAFNFFAWAQRFDTTPGDIALVVKGQALERAA